VANFFTDNSDRLFHFNHLNLKEIVEWVEDNFKQSEIYENAPENYEDAMDTYQRILEVAGEICADVIAPLSSEVCQRYPESPGCADQSRAQWRKPGATLWRAQYA
jgi:hypothetical protein